MHEKNKYRHIPWNRYNFEKYREMSFLLYHPALKCMYKLKHFVASAEHFQREPTHTGFWLAVIFDWFCHFWCGQTNCLSLESCCIACSKEKKVRKQIGSGVKFFFFFFFTKSRHLHGNNTQSDKPPWALGPSAHSPPRWWGLLWAEGPEGSGWGAAVSERDCGKSPVPKTLEQRKWPFKILQAIIKGHCLCRKVS